MPYGIDMALHDMAAQTIHEPDRPFEVDRIARRKSAEVRAGEGLVGHIGFPPVITPRNNGKTTSVDSCGSAHLHILQHFGRANTDLGAFDGLDGAEFFDDAGEHGTTPRRGGCRVLCAGRYRNRRLYDFKHA